MKKLSLLFAGVLSFTAFCASEITVEAETFKGKCAIRTNRHGTSGKSFVGKFKELTNTVNIPEAGKWYIWVRYSHDWSTWAKKLKPEVAGKMRSFELTAGENKLLFESTLPGNWGWGRRQVTLPKGEVMLKLRAVGVDPYVDLIVLTRDEKYIPKRDFARPIDGIDTTEYGQKFPMITLEAESFQGKCAIRTNRPGHSGNSFVGKFTKLTHAVNIPHDGIWYVWMRSNQDYRNWVQTFGKAKAEKMRSLKLTIGGNEEVFDAFAKSPWGWSRRKLALKKGPDTVTVEAVGIDPYFDLVIFTQDEKFIPKRNYTSKTDEISGMAVIPPTPYILKIPRGKNFVKSSPMVLRSGKKAKHKSEVFLRHDGKTLFVRIECEQPKSTLKLHNGDLWYQDGAEFVLDGNRSLKNIRHIILTPSGKIYSDKDGSQWQCPWKKNGGIKENSWFVELEIPLADILDELPDNPGKIRANFCRTIQYNGEFLSWSPFGKGFADPLTCGELIFDDMSKEEWLAIYLETVNKKAAAIGEKSLPADASAKDILLFERKLQNIIQKKFAPPAGQDFVFEKTNLLPNANFEYGKVTSGTIAPLNWNCSDIGKASITDGGYKGGNALKIDQTGKGFKIAAAVRPYIDSTLEYEWSGFFKSDVPGNKISLNVVWYVLDFEIETGWGGIRKHSESSQTIVPGKEWKRFTAKFIPPKGAVNCEFEIVAENSKGGLWCDQFYFDGMGTAKTEFIIPQPGFDAAATKKVIISSEVPLTGQVELISGGKVAASVKPVKYGKSRWKGDCYYADFSAVTAPGSYQLQCTAGNKVEKSHAFVIEKNLYMRLAKFASQFYFIQRQGVDAPGWHKANFLDDAVIIDKVTGKITGRRDVSGGWQDAGDPSKQAPADLSIFGLSEFFENTQCVEYNLKEKYPDILALAWPEVYRQIYKCYDGGGKFIGVSVNNMNNARYHHSNADVGKFRTRSIHKLTPDKWTDNIPGTWDDRFITGPAGLQWMVSGLSKFAISIRKYDPEVAKKITQVISEDYPVRQARQTLWKNNPYERVARGDGELAKIAIHLFILTGDEKYRSGADGYISEILKMYQAKYYRTDKKILLNSVEERYNFFNQSMTLFDYLRYMPDGKHASAVKKELKDFVDYLYNRSLDNEFGIVDYIYNGPGFRLGAPDWYREENGTNRRIARLGYLAARAGRLFKDERYLKYADSAAQFIIGRNPKNISMLIGNGWKFAATATTMRFCEGHSDGVLPGAVVRGMTRMPDSPPDFPAINVSSNPGGCAKGIMHEVWQEDTNAFILICQELAMARKEAAAKK